MKELKESLLYSSSLWDNYKNLEEAKESLKDIIMENKDYESEEEITDQDVFDLFYSDSEFNYIDFIATMESHFEKLGYNSYLVVATLGRWDGTYDGGKILSCWDSIRDKILRFGYDDVKVYQHGNDLKLVGMHHDGRDGYTVYQLTDKGTKYVENHQMDSDRELHNHLMEKAGYVRKIFGKTKLEG